MNFSMAINKKGFVGKILLTKICFNLLGFFSFSCYSHNKCMFSPYNPYADHVHKIVNPNADAEKKESIANPKDKNINTQFKHIAVLS